MNDDSLVKIMSSLGLNFNPAEQSIKSFEARIASLNKQLLEMKALALQGARDINAAFSSQLGRLGGSKVILDQFGQPLKTVQTETTKASASIGNMAGEYAKTSTAAKKYGETVQDTAKKFNLFADEWNRRTGWFLSGALFFGGINAAKEAIQSISEVEMGVTQIARVMEDATFVFKDYRDELLQLGIDYGQTFDVVQDIALRWAQAGYNVRNSLDLTKTSLLALNTAELDATKATESMIGIMAQWGLTAKDLLLVLDKINKTADDFTVTSQDLVDGLLRSSGAAKIMGLSLDQTIALLTVMREASGRTGREVGNALNSILSYVQRPKSIEVLENLGIQVFADKAKTQFRNVMEIFQDVAARWDTLSTDIQDGFVKAADDAGLFNEELAQAIGIQDKWNDLQQRDIAQAAAGVYRRNYFIGMIKRLSQAQEVLNNMMDAAGYSMRENERTMDTLEKKYNSLKTAAQELAVALGDAGLLDMLKGLIDLGTGAIQVFNELPQPVKDIIINFTLLIAATKALISIGTLLGVTWSGVFKTLTALSTVSALAPAVTRLGNALLAVRTSLSLWGGPILLGVTAVTAGIIALSNASRRAREEMDEFIKSKLADASTTQKQLDETNKLINEYESLKAKTEQTAEVKTQLHNIEKRLAELYPSTVNGIDQQNEKYTTQIELVKQLAAEKLKMHQQDIELLASQGKLKVDELIAERDRMESELERVRTEKEKAKAEFKGNEKLYQKIYGKILKGENTSEDKEFQDLIQQVQAAGYTHTAGFMLDMQERMENWTKLAKQEADLIEKLEKNRQERLKYGEIIVEAEKLKNPQAYSSGLPEWVKQYNYGKGTAGVGTSIQVLPKEFTEESLKALLNANKISLQTYLDLLRKIRKEKYSEYLNKSAQEINDLLNNPVTAEKTKAFLSLEAEIQSATSKGEKLYKTNEALQNALRLLEHRKNLNKISLEDEIAYLRKIEQLYARTGEERMDIEERIYNAEQALMDKRLQDSINWINEKKSLDQLSAQEEIAAWNRVREKHKDNIEAVKEAEKNLYNLRKELREKEVEENKKAVKSLQDEIKDAYEERIDLIDKEIDKINDAKKSIRRSEEARDYQKEMASLQEQLAYWSVRTSEDARKKVAELTEQIAEKQHDREVELQEQALDDKIALLEEEKKKWQTAYEELEDAFSDHNINIVAMAATYSKQAYEEWKKNYIDKLKLDITTNNLARFQGDVSKIGPSIENLSAHDWGMTDADYQKMMANKERWWELYNAGFKESMNAQMQKAHAENDAIRRKYGRDPALGEYPKFHTGAKTLSYGLAMFKPGELVFPPELSTKLEALISVLNTRPIQQVQSYPVNDNRREIKIDKLLNIENNRMEDEIDGEILSKQLQRAVLSIK